jgi:plastocyanin
MRRLRLPLVGLFVGFLAPAAAAQQFVYQPGALPGVARWTEGVECADVDNDGDFDIFFGEGDGFSGAGTARQNILIINKLMEIGPGNYADESIARLGVHVSNAKGVITADVDGDGYVDAMFCNAFNIQPPWLYHNRAAAQPGFYDMESATRGFTEALNAASGQFGDLDDDGDLDLIINDSGTSFLGGSGDEARLYFNDGGGNFTENAGALGAPAKRAQMDVQLVDVDNDFDLDFIGVCRSSNAGGAHYLMINDGAGNFTNMSASISSNSGSTYEAEVGDLDGDSDLDMFFVSLSGFSEGASANQFVPSGTVSFPNGSTLPPGTDDNEIVLIDYDNDGDLDSMVGSLGSAERMYRNNGGMSFSSVAVIQGVSDSTLDATAVDIDLDGDYDLITAQGESNSSQYANKLYLNTGPADTRPPITTGKKVPAAPASWPVRVHAKMRDSVIDDGVTYVDGKVAYVPLNTTDSAVDFTGGAFVPAVLNITAGTRVVWNNLDGSFESITSDTTGYAYNLDLSGGGSMAEYVFVSPGTYDYSSFLSGASGQIVVTGSPSEVDGMLSGGGIYRFELPSIAMGGSSEVALEFLFTDNPGNTGASESCTFTAPPGACVGGGVNYCTAAANSVGAGGAVIGFTGSTSIAANNLTLVTTGGPAAQPGLYYYGQAQIDVAFGEGRRCVGGNTWRLNPPVFSDGAGSFTRFADSTSAPMVAGSGMVMAGSVFNFQLWYRDPAGGPSGFNLSDGLELTFCP